MKESTMPESKNVEGDKPRVDMSMVLSRYRESPAAWRSLALNLIPFFGVMLLGWQVEAAVFAFWLEAVLVTLGATAVLCVQLVRAGQEGVTAERIAAAVVAFLILAPLLNLFNIAAGAMLLMPWFLDSPRALATLMAPEVLAGYTAMLAFAAWQVVVWLRDPDPRAVRNELREGLYLSIFRVFMFAIAGAHLGVVFALLGWWGGLIFTGALGLWMSFCEVMRPEILAAMGVDQAFHEAAEKAADLKH
jgi:hypothetical protein